MRAQCSRPGDQLAHVLIDDTATAECGHDSREAKRSRARHERAEKRDALSEAEVRPVVKIDGQQMERRMNKDRHCAGDEQL